MTITFDLISIGGGSGGLSVANRAASYGARAAVIEHDRLGGTCVNRGCVPKKIMWFGAGFAQSLQEARGYGYDVGINGHDWPALVAKRVMSDHSDTTPRSSTISLSWKPIPFNA